MLNVLRRIAMGIGGIVAVALISSLAAPRAAQAVVSALVTVANTAANPVPTEAVKESRDNFISISFAPDISSTYMEVSPDGTISSTPFSIPAGQRFVITDVNWITACENFFGITCNKSAGSAAILVLGSSASFEFGSYMSQAIYAPAANSNFLTAGRSDRLKSGLVVTQLPLPSILFGPSGDGETIVTVNLRGYLVP
jgi:hypothetical protein